MALPVEVGLLADAYYVSTATHGASTANAVGALWNSVPLDMSILEGWPIIAGPVLDTITQEQTASALMAGAYLQAQAEAQGFSLESLPVPTEFATPTERSAYWNSYAVGSTLSAANYRGLAEVIARRIGLEILMRTANSMVLDAGREAVQAGMTMTPTMVGYYRKLRTPSCDRCAVLAGAFYRWNEGFLRHPNCDCEHVPAADYDDSLAFDSFAAIEAGQITGLSKADTQAILEDGADVNSVINAKRGMRHADVFGERIKITSEGTTRRSIAGARLIAEGGTGGRTTSGRYFVAQRMRLTPSEIYRQAGMDRELARRLLYKHGYVL